MGRKAERWRVAQCWAPVLSQFSQHSPGPMAHESLHGGGQSFLCGRGSLPSHRHNHDASARPDPQGLAWTVCAMVPTRAAEAATNQGP